MTVSIDSGPLPIAQQPVPLVVVRVDRNTPAEEGQLKLLPNVWCSRVERRDGAEPSAATFHYILDSTQAGNSTTFPRYFQEFWPITRTGPYTIQPDDELAVFGIASNGTLRPLFNGFATSPAASVTGAGQDGTFQAAGVEIRLWDTPIGVSVWRDANTPNIFTPNPGKSGSSGVLVALDTRFNPNDQGEPQSNCTPDGKDFNQGMKNAYPAFIEPKLVREPDPATFWTLAKAVRYLLYAPIFLDESENPMALSDSLFVQVPFAATLSRLLMSLEPNNDETFDPADSSTYTAQDIVLRDTDIGGMTPIDALEQLLGYYNFGMRFDLTMPGGNPNPPPPPVTKLVIYRKDSLGSPAPKQLGLQALGATLDPGQSNATAIHLARDHTNLYNAVEVVTKRVQYEISIVLAPAFDILATDAENFSQFDKSNLDEPDATAELRLAYRVYIADECGDGHWDFPSQQFVTNVRFNWSDVFPPDEATGLSTFVERYRPGKMSLIRRDEDDVRRKANLNISRDYSGKAPALWDGTGHWQPVKNWKLLKDRLGIEIHAENPEAWHIGKAPDGFTAQNSSDVVRGVTSLANPSQASGDLTTGLFYLMLTTVVESDQTIDAKAGKRKASPTQYTVWRRIDAKDHYRKEEIHDSSVFFDSGDTQENEGDDDQTETEDPNIPRDDTDRAKAMADAWRNAHEFPRLAGTVTIPALTNAYNVGDRLNLITGVNVSLRTNAATEAGEAPFYPTIVGRTWEFTATTQATKLMITDRRAEPQRPTG